MVMALIALWFIFVSLTSGGLKDASVAFLSFHNISDLFNRAAIIGIIGCTMVMIIETGGIDFAAGSTAGLTGCIAAVFKFYLNFDIVSTIIIQCQQVKEVAPKAK
jgi:D-xylose transport system permease protein